jgi:hypothetical protein
MKILTFGHHSHLSRCCASVRVTRETAPEAIDQLERRRLELEVEIHALEVSRIFGSDKCSQ